MAIKVGITGGIGSGKTTVCKIFELLNVPVFYSDKVARYILETDIEAIKGIVDLFGRSVFMESKLIDRKKLAEIVFNNKEKLNSLNSIIHPIVAKHFDEWVLQNNDAKYILKEAAILFESGANKQVNKIISVIAPLDIRINRVADRDKINRVEIEQRIKNQMKDIDLVKMSDFVVNNDEKSSVIKQVLDIHNSLNLI